MFSRKQEKQFQDEVAYLRALVGQLMDRLTAGDFPTYKSQARADELTSTPPRPVRILRDATGLIESKEYVGASVEDEDY